MSHREALADLEERVEADPRSAVLVGVWASGARCVLQYVIAPVLGFFGFWLPWFGVLVQVLGCLVTVTGAVAVVRSRRRGWPFWVSVAVVVSSSTGWAVVTGVAALSSEGLGGS